MSTPLLAQERASLIATIRSLGEARTDAARDSINTAIKSGLRNVLDADDAFSTDLSALPMSRVEAPDGRFRLLTWNVPYSDGHFLYEGFLLVQDPGRRVLYELRDMTDGITTPLTKKLTPDNWYGALYYAVVPKTEGKRTYYTLLGWKGFSSTETRKVIEVLSFNGPVPTFGAAIFDEGRARHVRRIFAFNAQGTMSLKWDAPNDAIVLDHLAPTRPEFAGRPEWNAPDLSFDAYVWHKGEWSYLRDVDARNMDLAPKPHKPPPKGLKP